ncbi:hypothetical protein J4Q44_G00067030 [Coregonus suidteri]|uniref:Uncharacterized protein n=1 Tax=Coregonus suidteri TaxID=861788 RepID=A0AAN8MB52_9TELE
MHIILEQSALFKEVTMEMKMDAFSKHCFSDLAITYPEHFPTDTALNMPLSHVTPAVPQHLIEEEISLVRQHRDAIRVLQCAMKNVEEDNQALRMEVRRLREELSSTVNTSHMQDLQKELHELRQEFLSQHHPLYKESHKNPGQSQQLNQNPPIRHSFRPASVGPSERLSQELHADTLSYAQDVHSKRGPTQSLEHRGHTALHITLFNSL